MQRRRETVPLALSFRGKGILWRPEFLLSLLSHGTTEFSKWTTGLISESINGREIGARMIILMYLSPLADVYSHGGVACYPFKQIM